MVGTDEKTSWVGKSSRRFDLKGAGYALFKRTPMYMVFPAAVPDLKSAPPSLAASLAEGVLLAAGVEHHPP
jgi:hypothetical protein